MSTLRISIPVVLMVAFISACAQNNGECESSLTLNDGDRGSTRSINDGCTSVTVSLARDPLKSWGPAPTVSDTAVLRFDYRMETDSTVEYFLTPLNNGETQISIQQQPSGQPWTSTVQVAIPR